MTDRPPVPTRRAPADLRRGVVTTVSARTPWLHRVVVEGPELVGLPTTGPAGSVRLLLPRTGAGGRYEPVTWNGNEFLFADGVRPPIRTLTPVEVDPTAGRLVVDVVRHAGGSLSDWVAAGPVGDEVGVSEPGAGYRPPPAATAVLVVGDESALPAVEQVLTALPPSAAVDALLEVGDRDARIELPHHPGATVTWLERTARQQPGDATLDAVRDLALPDDVHVWAAGEAAAVQRLRKLLLGERGIPRERAVIRGYWKKGRVTGGVTG